MLVVQPCAGGADVADQSSLHSVVTCPSSAEMHGPSQIETRIFIPTAQLVSSSHNNTGAAHWDDHQINGMRSGQTTPKDSAFLYSFLH